MTGSLSAQAVTVRLGGVCVLDALSLSLPPGRVTCIIGPNGAGKSTLMACLAGLRRPDTGHVALGDAPVLKMPPRLRARRVGFLPQIPEVAWAVEAETLIALGRTPYVGPMGLATPDREAVRRAMLVTETTAFAFRVVNTLSGGERARVLIARALAGEPEWLLADEPLAGLDPGHQIDACDLLRRLAHEEGRGVVMTLHDLPMALRVADHVVVMAKGRILAEGLPRDALAPDVLQRAYGVETRLIQGLAGRSWNSSGVTVAELALDAWSPAWRTAAALGVEAAIGYPAMLHRSIPHPVAWPAAAIGALERRWNRAGKSDSCRKTSGVAALMLVVGAAIAAGLLLQQCLQHFVPPTLRLAVFAVIASVGLAQRSLYLHVADVLRPLTIGDLAAARLAVGRIVGRDTGHLDEHGVAAAALESLAESFNDGVTAPAFWLIVGGLPGLFAYKAVNTADSLIGHREPRWRAFGWASARADDVMNLIPARLAGGLIALAGGRGGRVMLRDAHRHASPNAGWPEAAMAGALKVRLGGPARYDGVVAQRPAFGDGPPPSPSDLRRGLRLYVRACLLLFALVVIAGLLWPR